MSNTEGGDSSKGDEIDVPPINLPDPDPFDTSKSNEGKNSFAKKSKKKGKKKKRSHPLDRHQDVRREKKGMGCCGGIGCFVLLIILLIVGGLGYTGYALFGDFKDYTIVQLEGMEETISEAPVEPTFYVGQGKVIYQAPATTVPVAIFGKQVEVSGDFAETLSLRGSEVTCRAGTHCRKDLNVYAVKYINEGVQVDGAKLGKTLQ